jgi:shikimate kinase
MANRVPAAHHGASDRIASPLASGRNLTAAARCGQYAPVSTETIEDNPSPEHLVTAAGIARRLGGRPIVLVGMMGAGKSSIGKRLASRLGLPFCDADTEIERAANQTIPEIFEQHGEAYFRAGERRVILRLVAEGSRVIATGGGAYMDPETRAAIAAAGIAIWLNADLEVLLARVRRRGNRPLLKNGDPEETLRRLIAERYPVYAGAPIHVKSREVSHETVIEEVMGALDAWLDQNPPPATQND